MNKKSTCIFHNIFFFFLIVLIKKPNIIAIHYLYKYKMSPYIVHVYSKCWIAVKQDQIILETIQRNVTYIQDISGSYQTSKTDQTSLYLQFIY